MTMLGITFIMLAFAIIGLAIYTDDNDGRGGRNQ